MKTKSEIGKAGENAVAEYLVKRGYNIIFRNYRIRGGEIDIIAENGQFISFVEVKSRKSDSLYRGIEAVTQRKKNLIIKTAIDYFSKYPTNLQPTFDVAEVIMLDEKIIDINYIKNAFDLTGLF